MKKPLQSNNFILHRETSSGVRQWHFTSSQILSISVLFSVIFIGSLFIGTDLLSKFLYEKRIDDFKSNYKSMASNLEGLRDRLEMIDLQMSQIENKDRAVRAYAGMPDIDKDIRKLGIGGRSLEDKLLVDNLAPAVVKELSVLELDLEKISREVNLELASYNSIYEKVKTDIDRIKGIPSIRPVEGGYLNSGYGYRKDPIDGARRFHQGQDITVKSGTPVYAPADGVVKRAYYVGGFGNHIKLNHDHGYTTTYAHLSKIKVKHGQKVKRGDVIGLTGNTGRSTAPHLHYEIHYYGTPQNPLDYFFNIASR
tara:strand:- start:1152 stop:2081 length:930 start_codon:yes stop_codon:yes gene_type:complete